MDAAGLKTLDLAAWTEATRRAGRPGSAWRGLVETVKQQAGVVHVVPTRLYLSRAAWELLRDTMLRDAGPEGASQVRALLRKGHGPFVAPGLAPHLAVLDTSPAPAGRAPGTGRFTKKSASPP